MKKCLYATPRDAKFHTAARASNILSMKNVKDRSKPRREFNDEPMIFHQPGTTKHAHCYVYPCNGFVFTVYKSIGQDNARTNVADRIIPHTSLANPM